MYPAVSNLLAVSSPIPDEAPVTNTVAAISIPFLPESQNLLIGPVMKADAPPRTDAG
jgi:hypothetical protein